MKQEYCKFLWLPLKAAGVIPSRVSKFHTLLAKDRVSFFVVLFVCSFVVLEEYIILSL